MPILPFAAPVTSGNNTVFSTVVAVWHLNSSLTDVVGGFNMGDNLDGNPHWSYTNGFHNNALSMTNQNTTSGVQVGSNPTLSAGSGVSFTVTCWMNDQGGTDANNPLIAKWNASKFEYLLAFVKPSLGLIFQANNLAGSSQPFVKTNSPTSSAWHFVACGYDDSLQQIWIQLDNGARVNTACVGVKADTASLAFMNYSDANTGIASSWLGFLDEVYLWKRVLTTTEITTLWNGGAGTFYTP